MLDEPGIDTAFDVRSDAGVNRRGEGRDPDRYSPTLRRYHRLLWSKPLPNGTHLDLTESHRGEYLYNDTDAGGLFLGSDSIVHSLSYLLAMQPVIGQVPVEDIEEFKTLGSTVGGTIVFPSNRIDGGATINGACGMHPGIRDRFDLTLECIRLHYDSTANPLAEVLQRYASFFDLFRDFRGYVDFFLLQDLVGDEGSVRFLTAFDGFPTQPLPRTVEEYHGYRARSLEFVRARNARIGRTAARG